MRMHKNTWTSALAAVVCAVLSVVSQTASATLVAHYEFEELGSTTTTADSSGNGHTGALEGNSVIINDATRGNVFKGELYSGTAGEGTGVNIDSTVAIPNLPANGGVTLAAWVNRSTTNGDASDSAYVIGLGGTGDLPIMTLGITDVTGTVTGYFEGDSALNDQTTVAGAAGAVTDGVWTHIAITYDRLNDVAKVYVNGLQSGSDVDISGGGDGILNWADATVGRFVRVDTTRSHFPGLIDDARIYYEVLDGSEIGVLAGLEGPTAPEPSTLTLLVFGVLTTALIGPRRRSRS